MIVEIAGRVFSGDSLLIRANGKVVEVTEDVASLQVLTYDGSASDGENSEIDLS